LIQTRRPERIFFQLYFWIYWHWCSFFFLCASLLPSNDDRKHRQWHIRCVNSQRDSVST